VYVYVVGFSRRLLLMLTFLTLVTIVCLSLTMPMYWLYTGYSGTTRKRLETIYPVAGN